MDFSRKQYDSLSLRYYRGVISHKENSHEHAVYKIYIIKMVKLSQGI